MLSVRQQTHLIDIFGELPQEFISSLFCIFNCSSYQKPFNFEIRDLPITFKLAANDWHLNYTLHFNQ